MAILKNNPVGYDIGHGVTVYNLENQVLKNKVDIQNLKTSEKVLATFGIEVIGEAANSTLIPTVSVYKANNPDWKYGDAYAVGTASPYEFYILTRANETHPEDYWFNLGVIKGPKGDAGTDGANGADGKDGISPTVAVGTVTTGNPGTPVSVTNGGTSTNVVLNFRIPKGDTGDKGAKGDKGDTGFAVNIASELNNINELPTASASHVNIGYVIKDADGDSNLYVCMTNASTGAWYWNNVGKIAFSADYVSQNEYNQDKLTDIPVTLYDGGNQNTTINLKNGNGNLIGTGFGFGTINGNDILVNSNDVEGNLNVVEYIDLRNFTTDDMEAATTTPATRAAILEAFKHWLRKKKIYASGEAPTYDYSVGGKAATLLLKDGSYTLTDIDEEDLDDRYYTFEWHTIDSNDFPAIQIVDIKLIFEITWANQAPTTVADVTYELKQSLFNDTLLLTPATATQGTLTPTELGKLTTNKYCLIELNNEIYYLNDKQHTPGVLVYTHNGYEAKGIHKYISVTISTRGWVMVQEDSNLPVIIGTYSAAEGWISFDEQPKVRANGGTPYSIAIMSSLLGTTVMTMPIHLADINDSRIIGATTIGKMSIGDTIQVVSVTPFMVQQNAAWTLSCSAVILTGAQAGMEIKDQLMPTLTLIQLIQLA
nr:MAG TPA: hypothetical protein [Bacteriophage sp.]